MYVYAQWYEKMTPFTRKSIMNTLLDYIPNSTPTVIFFRILQNVYNKWYEYYQLTPCIY